MSLKVLDLFSGIGGFSLGLERTGGFKTVAFCEIDPHCQKILKKQWPGVPVYNDVSKLSLSLGFSDIICGGFPCQDISIAGKRAGITGSRSGLWKYMADAICVVRPKFALVENVAALLDSGLDVVLGDLAEIGYDCEWHCIPASAVGAPHRRDRWWGIAYPAGTGLSGLVKRKSILSQPPTPRPESFYHASGAWDSLDMDSTFLRARDGLPRRAHRIKSLGNAVVPQIPELIGRAILESLA